MDAEGQLIKRVTRMTRSKIVRPSGPRARFASRVILAVGDDAAILSPSHDAEEVLTCDAFLEDVHFLANLHPADSVGYKALARATSDVVAMGAAPSTFLLTIAIPARQTGEWLDQFSKGMARAAKELGVRLIGGDTTKASKVFISITVVGHVARGHAIRRSGARPGDLIYVSGRLGQAALGLELLRRARSGSSQRETWRRIACERHLYPKIRAELGAWLGKHRIPSAMIDISDGLSTDLERLCAASGAGARLSADRVPRVEIPATAARKLAALHLDPLQMALHGGEDYELLFTVSPGKVKRLRRAPGHSLLIPIGEITRQKQIVLVESNGQTTRLDPEGWDPFR